MILPNWLCEPYHGYIDDIIEVCRITIKYAQLIFCYEKYVVCCFCTLVSLTEYMYNENMTS